MSSLDGFTIISQNAKLAEITSIELIDATNNLRYKDDIATNPEVTRYRAVIGKLLFIGRLTHPIILHIASVVSTKISN